MMIPAIFAVLLLLAAIYLLVLIRPAARKPADARLLCDYAHRGLHDETIPENSLAAFEAACQAGCGIELDVQLSRDGTVMVFHDYTLLRMTGRDSLLSELDAAELKSLRLGTSDEHIPTLAEVLNLVDGHVPLLIELKGEGFDTALVGKLAETLAAYSGTYCVESFNPLLLGEVRKRMPGVYRGLLYTNVCKAKNKYSPLNLALTAMLTNVLARPDFIAYDVKMRTSAAVRITTRLYRAARFSWTLHGDTARKEAHQNGECGIFEKQ